MDQSTINIPATIQTPEVIFDPENGYYEIGGRSIMLDVEDFYGPLLEQFKTYIASHPQKIRFVLKLNCFSFTSLKRIMFFLYEIKNAQENGSEAEVIWMQKKGEDDLTEIAEELGKILDIKIKETDFVPVSAMAV